MAVAGKLDFAISYHPGQLPPIGRAAIVTVRVTGRPT